MVTGDQPGKNTTPTVPSSHDSVADQPTMVQSPVSGVAQQSDSRFTDDQPTTAMNGVPLPPGKPVNAEIPAANHDIVDTFWDIPPITFPTEMYDAGENAGAPSGPRHSASNVAAQAATQTIDMAFPALQARKTQSLGSAPAGSAPVSGPDPVVAQSETEVMPTYEGQPLFPTVPATATATKAKDADPFDIDFSAIEQSSVPVDDPGAPDPVSTTRSVERGWIPKTVVVTLAVILAIAVFVACGMFVWRIRSNREDQQLYSSALSSCNKAYTQYTDAKKALDKALSDSKTAQSVTSDQVADAATVNTLKQAISDANALQAPAECKESLAAAQLTTNAKAAKEAAKTAKSATSTITSAVKSVNDSKSAKTEAASKQSLQDKVTEAQTTLDNSLGMVADETTRDALQTAIDSANTLLQQNDPDQKSLQTAVTTLQTAIDNVNASIAELTAQQQAATQQQQTTVTPTPAPTYTDTNIVPGNGGNENPPVDNSQNQSGTNLDQSGNQDGSQLGNNTGNQGNSDDNGNGNSQPNNGGNGSNGSGTGTGDVGGSSDAGTGINAGAGSGAGTNKTE